MYQQGEGVVQDLERARQYWEAACAGTGDDFVAEAASNLGSMYRLGDGVVADLARARQLYERALAAGDEQAAMDTSDEPAPPPAFDFNVEVEDE